MMSRTETMHRLHHRADMVWIDIRQNAMPEIEHMA